MDVVIPEMLRPAFAARPIDAHKRSVGVVGVVGGCETFPHAPVLAALGARAAGAGLIRLSVSAASRAAAAALVPEASFVRADDADASRADDVRVVGMGLGTGEEARRLAGREIAVGCPRLVIDADALNALASFGEDERRRLREDGRCRILTPHEGEASRLLGWTRERVASDRPSAAREIAVRFGATVLLKGPGSLVVSRDGARLYRNATGNPFMALGGMGDLLAGVIGARWAYLKGGDPFLVVAGSAWLHGLAADRVVADGRDPSLVNVASEIGRLRVFLDGISSSLEKETCS